MEYVFNKTPRKADYITFLAIILFVFVIVFEVLLVSWLPSKMMAAKTIETETAKQEIIDLVDTLRKKIPSLDKRIKTGEVKLVGNCLDNIARYLRLNGSNMNREQIRDVMEDLTRFEMIIRHWSKNGSYLQTETLDTSPYFDDLFRRYTVEKCN